MAQRQVGESVIRNHDGVLPTCVIAATEVYQTPLLAGCEFRLARLLATADEWEETNWHRAFLDARGVVPSSDEPVDRPIGHPT